MPRLTAGHFAFNCVPDIVEKPQDYVYSSKGNQAGLKLLPWLPAAFVGVVVINEFVCGSNMISFVESLVGDNTNKGGRCSYSCTKKIS